MNKEEQTSIPTIAISVDLLDGQYEVLELISDSDIGVTYKAKDINTNSLVTIEVYWDGLNLDNATLERFNADLELLNDLEHESIVKTHRVFEVVDEFILDHHFQSTHAYVMDYVEGSPLSDYINTGIGEDDINPFFVKILEALSDLHMGGLVHKNINSSSIIIDKDLTPHIGRFGPLRSLPDEDFIAIHHKVRRAQYIPPQFYDQSLNILQSDLYAVGILLTELLTKSDRSTAVSAANSRPSSARVNHAAPRPLFSSLPKRYHYIVKRATRERANLRYDSAYKMMKDFSHPAKYFSEALSVRSAVMMVDSYENKFYIPSASMIVKEKFAGFSTVGKMAAITSGACFAVLSAGLLSQFFL